MRHRDQEITDRGEIDEIINKSVVCRIGLADGEKPYVVPMCFGYDGKHLYFHSAPVGMKIGILKKNDRICFEFDECGDITKGDDHCSWGIDYRSVIGFGRATLIEDDEEKRAALDIISGHYAEGPFQYDPRMFKAVAVIKVDIDEMTGKRSS